MGNSSGAAGPMRSVTVVSPVPTWLPRVKASRLGRTQVFNTDRGTARVVHYLNELFALFDADAFDGPHGEQVALRDRFFLHHAVEAFEEPLVESGAAVECLAVDVDEPLLRRVFR